MFTTFRFDDGTTANEPACGAYEAVIAVLLDDTFVAIDDVFVEIDCSTAVELTDIGAPAATETTTTIKIESNNYSNIQKRKKQIRTNRKSILCIKRTSTIAHAACIYNINN